MPYSDAYVVGLESQVDALQTTINGLRAKNEALVAWLRVYVEEDGFVTLEDREQARVLLEASREC